MSLAVVAAVRRGALELDVDLTVDAGSTLALLGPNGAGKTTLLRALAGLHPLAGGRVTLGGCVLDDPVAGVRVPPEARRTGWVPQDVLLLPHLGTLDNVAFGPRARGLRRAAARRHAGAWLDRLGASALAGRRPAALSGGEAQRVALARALAAEPELLLLDEPLAAVDAAARPELRRRLAEAMRGVPVRLVVTHDPLEAAVLADRVAVLEAGQLVQVGSVAEVTARPRSPWVAAMVGLNLYSGELEDGRLRLASGAALVVVTPLRGAAHALVHPRAVGIHRVRPQGSPRNCWPGRAVSLDLAGDRARVTVRGEPDVVAEVTPAAVAELRLAEGGPVWVSVKATEIEVFAA